MEIKILELKDDLVRIMFAGEGHTFMNALSDEILKNPDIDVANYSSRFKFTEPILTVTTKNGANPVEAVIAAAKKIGDNCEDIKAQIENA